MLRSRSLEEIKAIFRVYGQDSHMDLPGGRQRSEFVANAVRFPEASLLFTGYDSPIMMGFDPSSDLFLGYQLRDVSQVVVEGKVIENGIHHCGCLIPHNRAWSVRNPHGFQVLLLHLSTATLQRKLSAFLGSDHARLDLRQPAIAEAGSTARLRASVFELAREVEGADRRFLPQLGASAIEAICLGILLSLSEKVLTAERAPAAPSALQLGYLEQYIVANYTQTLTVETLAKISGVSGHSVFSHFLARYGCTPYAYLEQIRINMAHFMLAGRNDRDAVTSVALQCGFPSLTEFERAYRKAFGRPPVGPA